LQRFLTAHHPATEVAATIAKSAFADWLFANQPTKVGFVRVAAALAARVQRFGRRSYART
jgi:hypothetical protein